MDDWGAVPEFRSVEWEPGTARLRRLGEHPAECGPGDEATGLESAQCGEEVGLADAQGFAKREGGVGARGGAEALEDPHVEWIDSGLGGGAEALEEAGVERIGGGLERVERVMMRVVDFEVGGVAGYEAQTKR